MLLYVFIGITVWMVAVSVIQLFFALIYTVLLFRSRKQLPNAFQPKAAVILALRGSDPFLVANMAAVLEQDYPDFSLFIVVDSEQDSAWPEVRKVQSLAPNRVITMVLQKRLPTCSLKCSSLAQALENPDASYQVITFLDADASPHRTWLRELVAPLAEASIGVTTGNRWYTPRNVSWGAMVRYFWNAGAVVQVWLNDIVWGGSMAIRREVVDRIEGWKGQKSLFMNCSSILSWLG